VQEWETGKMSTTSEPLITPNGNVAWKNDHGQLHREDGPAVIWSDGTMLWYLHGQIHREDDLPAIFHPNGLLEWWMNDHPHRENGPAIIDHRDLAWYVGGVLIQ
jgi:hypothetical protein